METRIPSSPSDPTLTSATPSAVDPHTLKGVERGLKFASIFTVALGVCFAVGSTGSTEGPVRLFLDVIFLRVGDGPSSLTEGHHLANAILGGVMAGWGVTAWLLVDRFLSTHPRDVKHILTGGLAVWFVIDSAGSIASGGWLNAIGNIGFLALFALPLSRLSSQAR